MRTMMEGGEEEEEEEEFKKQESDEEEKPHCTHHPYCHARNPPRPNPPPS
jgi:hypothetical protein